METRRERVGSWRSMSTKRRVAFSVWWLSTGLGLGLMHVGFSPDSGANAILLFALAWPIGLILWLGKGIFVVIFLMIAAIGLVILLLATADPLPLQDNDDWRTKKRKDVRTFYSRKRP
jgi:hypothetical protein